MPLYRVQIETENLLAESDGKIGKYGFITFRVVEADDATAAEAAAIQFISEDEELSSLIMNEEADPPVLNVLEILEVESSAASDVPSGRIWYALKPKRWWQFWRR